MPDARLFLEGSFTLNVIFLRPLQSKGVSRCPNVALHQPFGLKNLRCPGVLMETIYVHAPSNFHHSPSSLHVPLLGFYSAHSICSGRGPLLLQSQWRSVCGETDRHTKTADRLQAEWVIFLKDNPDTIFPVLKTFSSSGSTPAFLSH